MRPPPAEPKTAVLIGLILVTVLAGGPSLAASITPAANVSIALYGKATSGWSESPGLETNPGPTLVVDEGDQVTMQLTDEDGGLTGGHTFWIDYDADGMTDFGTEPNSPTFDTVPITYSFGATAAGTFTYYCGIHSGPPYNPSSSLMRGTWVTRGAPSILISAPIGGASWTGGTAHDIVFDLQSFEPPGNLNVWVNYTYNAGAAGGAIAGPIPGTANPNVVSWTPIGFDAADVVINVTAVDTANRRGFRTSPPLEVDSMAPTVASMTPDAGATGVALNTQILIAWSEGMDRAATAAPSAFGVTRPADGGWLSGSITWSADSRQMAFTPAQNLDPFTAYRIHVNGTAKDDSVPGNALVAPTTSSFTTGATADSAPPVISTADANPGRQLKGGFVNLTAHVTDETSLGPVVVHIVGPSLDINLTMASAGGDVWFLNRSYGEAGMHGFGVWAVDSAGNVASRSGSFEIRVLTAPTSVAASVRPDGTIVVTWAAVNDADLLGYRIYRGQASGGPYAAVTPAPISPTPREYVDTSVQPGATYVYVVTAVDVLGNESPFSAEALVAVPARPQDALPWIVGAAVTVGGAIVVAFLLWRRRGRRREDQGGNL